MSPVRFGRHGRRLAAGTSLAVASAIALSAGPAQAVVGDDETPGPRAPLDNSVDVELPAGARCAFPVHIVVDSNEYVIHRIESTVGATTVVTEKVTGRYVITITNLVNGNEVRYNASGPNTQTTTYPEGPATLVGQGPQLLSFGRGSRINLGLQSPEPHGLFFTNGQTTVTGTNALNPSTGDYVQTAKTFTATKIVDVCAQLA